METDLEFGVASMFRDATMQNVVLELRTDADWDRFNEIKETTRRLEKDEHASFRRDKSELVTEACEKLQRKAGALTHEHPTPFGIDKFSKSNLERPAHAIVERDHQARLLKIKSDETEAFRELKKEIRTREGLHDHARDAFARTTDRRTGEERRMPDRSR